MTVRGAIFGCLIGATICATLLQFFIDSSAVNMLCVAIVAVTSLIVFFYLALTRALYLQPLSSFALLGFCMTTLTGALLVQTVMWTEIRFSLYDPVYTFATLSLYVCVALAVHACLRFFSPYSTPSAKVARRDGPVRGLLAWAQLYRTPSVGQLWIMGCVGLASFFAPHSSGVLLQLSLPFNFLAWSPYLIPFYLRQEGPAYCNPLRNRFFLMLYTGVIVLLGMGLNQRQMMFVGVLTIALLYLLAGMRNAAPLRLQAVGKFGALVAVLLVLSIPISNLATSMVIARELRGKVSPIAMIETTLHVWQRPALIAKYRAAGAASAKYSSYDEHYIMNPILARFVGTKYHDNAFHFANSLSQDGKSRLRDISIKFMWAALPTPILNRLHVQVDKDDLGFSMGDYLVYLSRGVPLGGRKIGSMFAQGIALFGPLFPFVYAVIAVGLFWLMDLSTLRPKAGVASMSMLGMLMIWSMFSSGITYEALQHAIYFFVRNFETTLIVFLSVYWMARLLTGGNKPPVAAASTRPWLTPSPTAIRPRIRT